MWYYESGGASQGPVEADEIRRLISVERVTRTTRIWREGFPDWLPAGQTEFGAGFPAGYGGPPMVQAGPAYSQPLSPYGGYGSPGYSNRQFAGFWIRAGAMIIDSLIFLVVAGVTYGVSIAVMGGVSTSGPQNTVDPTVLTYLLVEFGVLLLGYMLYTVISTAGRWQGTLGKRMVGIYVVPAMGGRVGFGLALGRYFAHIITNMVPLYIGYMMAGWTNEKRALHDMICDTRVIYGRP